MYLKIGDRVETPEGEGFVRELLPDGVVVQLIPSHKDRLFDYNEVYKV